MHAAAEPTVAPTFPAAADGHPLFLNREISWLDFNQRVLELAQDSSFPLLERVRFWGIFSSNLDEFFMKRVGGLQRQKMTGVTDRSNDGLNADEQLLLIKVRLLPLLKAHEDCWLNDLAPALAREGILLMSYESLVGADRAEADAFFNRQVFAILTPLAVDSGHPFPFISNLSKSLGVMLEHPTDSEPHFVRIKVPENLPRWIPLPTKNAFVPLEQVIGGNLSALFPGMKVLEHNLFRITRNADIEMDAEDADDLLDLVEQEVRRRRMAHVVRLELPESMSPMMRQFVVEGLDVDPRDVYISRSPIDSDDLMAIANIDLPHLKFAPWLPRVPARLVDDEVDLFSVIRSNDLLVHHPYEDFRQSVERFISAAADDPKTLAIKMTLYRTTADSGFIPALIKAAEAGKQVAVLVELKARFDEQRNVELATRLEKAGVHVVYGLVGLKTHTKLAMVVRDEPEGLRTYVHIGTGNYNPKTATLYTDLGLFTCNADVTADVVEVFHYLTGRSLKRDYRKLLVAPVNMRTRFLQKIRREIEHAKAGKEGRIVAKMNALQDPIIIQELYKASNAGVKTDLIVRGFCCLRPGVAGMSENIRVFSILGRFLEHSRIFNFNNAGDEEFYIGSADWMYRNLDYRVEAITPVEDPPVKAMLKDILDTMLADTGHAWQLDGAGAWARRVPDSNGKPLPDTQVIFMDRYAKTGKKKRRR